MDNETRFADYKLRKAERVALYRGTHRDCPNLDPRTNEKGSLWSVNGLTVCDACDLNQNQS